MKNKAYLLLVIILISIKATAQNQTVSLDLITKKFNNGGVLPAEKHFNITVRSPRAADLIQVQIHKRIDKPAFYTSSWERKLSGQMESPLIPIDVKLYSGSYYDFKVKSYRKLNKSDRLKIASQLSQSGKSFIESSIVRGARGYQFKMKSKEIFQELNQIVAKGLSNLEVSFGQQNNQLSDVVAVMISNLENTSYKDLLRDSTDANYKNAISIITAQIDNELVSMVNSYSFVLVDVTEIMSYPTEKTMNFLSVNAGYGGIYRNTSEDFEYFDGPFAGISFPLANYALNSSFISKTSFSFGIFLKNFEDNNIRTTGPIVDKPIYAALGYRFLNFVKLSAGTTIIEEKDLAQNTTSDVKFRPFIGLGIEMDFWLGLKKK